MPAAKRRPAQSMYDDEETGEQQPPETYYGFDPAVAYLIRSRVRGYTGATEKFPFANGQAIAYPMVEGATEQQKEARCERLGRIHSNPTYRIYLYGNEPPAHREPMWADQEDPTSVGEPEDTGEATHVWQPVPTKPAVQQPVEGPTPSGRTSRELREALPPADQDTGEQQPPPPEMGGEPPRQPAWERVPGAEPDE